MHVNHSWLLEIIINISFEYLYRNCSVISPFLLTSEKGGKKVVLLYFYYSCIYFFMSFIIITSKVSFGCNFSC